MCVCVRWSEKNFSSISKWFTQDEPTTNHQSPTTNLRQSLLLTLNLISKNGMNVKSFFIHPDDQLS